MSTSASESQQQKSAGATPPTASAAPAPKPAAQTQKETEGPLLFHFAECTSCRHILPLSTATEKYFAILSKDPKKPVGLGEKCMRCGADSWVLVTG